MKWKWIRRIFRALAVLVGLWALLLVVVFFYIRNNKSKIIQLIKSNISRQIAGEVKFDDVSANFFENFPGVSSRSD